MNFALHIPHHLLEILFQNNFGIQPLILKKLLQIIRAGKEIFWLHAFSVKKIRFQLTTNSIWYLPSPACTKELIHKSGLCFINFELKSLLTAGRYFDWMSHIIKGLLLLTPFTGDTQLDDYLEL